MPTLTDRYHRIKHHLPCDVTLLAVSKTKPADDICTLWQAGQVHFGENYLQEALAKQQKIKDILGSSLNERPLIWHYIGHIQRNKTRDIARHFAWVQTVDRAIIAKRLNEQRPDELPALNVLIQVNVDDEPTKSGCLPGELPALIETVMHCDKLALRGLMIIPSQKMDDNNNPFARTYELFTQIKNQYHLPNWDTLSMGMSGDKELAIAHGSTMVRVGSALFGARH